MTLTLTPDQRKALENVSDAPIMFVDEATNRVWYLVSSEQYESLKNLLDDSDFKPREAYPLIAKTAAAAGWADPQMDAYDHYDEQRAKG